MTVWTGTDLHMDTNVSLVLVRVYDRSQSEWSIPGCNFKYRKAVLKKYSAYPKKCFRTRKFLSLVAENPPHVCGFNGAQIQCGWRLDVMYVHGKNIFLLIKFTFDSYVFWNVSVSLRLVICNCDSQLWIVFRENVRSLDWLLSKKRMFFFSEQKHYSIYVDIFGLCFYGHFSINF